MPSRDLNPGTSKKVGISINRLILLDVFINFERLMYSKRTVKQMMVGNSVNSISHVDELDC